MKFRIDFMSAVCVSVIADSEDEAVELARQELNRTMINATLVNNAEITNVEEVEDGDDE
ncbi:MAG: hypothetical protein IJ640_00765 [Prevotella sp.]|nr:hypothetical protein [Prevotella sp.]